MREQHAILQTDKLCKTFSTGGLQQHVLKNLDIELYEGDFTVSMSVLDNVLVSGLLTSINKKKTAAKAKELLKQVGILE